MCPGPFSARCALRAHRHVGLDILLDLGDARAGQEEDDEEREREVPGVHGVRDGRGCGSGDPCRGQAVVGMCTIYQGQRGRHGDDGFHGCVGLGDG